MSIPVYWETDEQRPDLLRFACVCEPDVLSGATAQSADVNQEFYLGASQACMVGVLLRTQQN